MISAQDIVDAVAPLNEESRALLIDFARLLRDRNPLMLPATETLDARAFERWCGAIEENAREVLERHKEKLELAGFPTTGSIPESQWPKDMTVESVTSVET